MENPEVKNHEENKLILILIYSTLFFYCVNAPILDINKMHSINYSHTHCLRVFFNTNLMKFLIKTPLCKTFRY